MVDVLHLPDEVLAEILMQGTAYDKRENRLVCRKFAEVIRSHTREIELAREIPLDILKHLLVSRTHVRTVDVGILHPKTASHSYLACP